MVTPEENLDEKMETVTLTMDRGRHSRLRTTSGKTRISMSELTRIALDRLWNDLGDLNNPSPKALAILFNGGASRPLMGAPAARGRRKT